LFDIDGLQDCTACDAVERRAEMCNHLIGLSPYMSVGAKAWAAYQFALRWPVAAKPPEIAVRIINRSGKVSVALSGDGTELLIDDVAAKPSEVARQTVDDVLLEMQPGGALYQPPSAVDEKKIIAIAKSMPRKPWGIGSRREDAIAFAWEVLKAAPTAAVSTAQECGNCPKQTVYGEATCGQCLAAQDARDAVRSGVNNAV
jgi:hypothetical protein